jgi:Domain of unknown function (DUF1707)
MARRASLRASDADRDRVAERLRNAAAEGRLLAHELEHRVATALRARTYGELDAIVADLPGERRSRRPARSLRSMGPVPTCALLLALPVVFAVVVAVVAVVFAMLTTWIVVAAVLWLAIGHRRRWYGPRYVMPRRPQGLYGPRRTSVRPGFWI